MAGLTEGHAYSIIRAEAFGSYRLLNIRNPWGRSNNEDKEAGEWAGDWSDKSELWHTVPGAMEHFNPTLDSHDGNFWISIEDFFKTFEDVGICKIEDWNECRIKGKFINMKETTGNNFPVSKFYYKF